MELEWYIILALVGTGIAAGFFNTTAGGGSMLSIPLLMFIGLPANVANGTNRVAIVLQNIVAVGSFRKKKIIDIKTDYRLAVPAIAGAILGAFIAVEIDVDLLKKVIAGLMVLMLFVVLLKPDAWVKQQAGKVKAKPSFLQYVIFFFVGVYGGFIQMGIGFFMLAALVLGAGYDLVKANSIKVLIALLYTSFALVILFYHNQVDITAGLMLAAGNMIGAWIGVHFQVKGGAKYVRYVLILAMVIVILNLFGVFG